MLSIKELLDHLSQEERYLSAISYLPFIGWLFPLYLRRESALCQSHGKQGFLLAVIFTALIVFFTLFETFVPNDVRIFRLVLVIMVYVLYLLYFALLAASLYGALRERKLLLPVIGRYAGQLQL